MQADGFGGSDEAAIRQLEALGREIVAALPEAVAAGAEILSVAAATLAPVRTGKLFQSAETEPRDADGISATHRVWFEFYGYFQEFGTVKMAAQPFLLPAAEMYRQDIEEAMRSVVDTAVGDAIVSHRYVETRK